MEDLSPYYQRLIAGELFGMMIQGSEQLMALVRARQLFLSDCGCEFEETLLASQMAQRFELESHHPGSVILERLSEGENLYFVYKGTCIARLRNRPTDADEPDPRKKIRRLVPMDFFGEIGLYYGCQRTASVISPQYSTLGRLQKASF